LHHLEFARTEGAKYLGLFFRLRERYLSYIIIKGRSPGEDLVFFDTEAPLKMKENENQIQLV